MYYNSAWFDKHSFTVFCFFCAFFMWNTALGNRFTKIRKVYPFSFREFIGWGGVNSNRSRTWNKEAGCKDWESLECLLYVSHCLFFTKIKKNTAQISIMLEYFYTSHTQEQSPYTLESMYLLSLFFPGYQVLRDKGVFERRAVFNLFPPIFIWLQVFLP